MFFGIWQFVFLGDDNGPQLGIFSIELNPLLGFRLGIRTDRISWTFRLTYTAIDALVWMDNQHVFALIETVYRADLYAVGVFAINAGVVNDIGHK